ncbi:MAG: hypothetical protein JOZ57_08980 [Abitibacteriaceae bacterium]|nr:hypothetical protein [Abditibacteriaceae bacterium]
MHRTWLKPQRIKLAQRWMLHQWALQREGWKKCPSSRVLPPLTPGALRREIKVLQAEVRARESHKQDSYP